MTWGWGDIGHGGLLRVFPFTCPMVGSGHVYGIYPQTCPDDQRLGFSWIQNTAPISWGRIVSRVTIVECNPIYPKWKTKWQTLYCRYLKALPWLTPVNHWCVHRCWSDEPEYAAGNPLEDNSQISLGNRWRLVLPCPRSVPCCTACNRRNRSL